MSEFYAEGSSSPIEIDGVGFSPTMVSKNATLVTSDLLWFIILTTIIALSRLSMVILEEGTVLV